MKNLMKRFVYYIKKDKKSNQCIEHWFDLVYTNVSKNKGEKRCKI